MVAPKQDPARSWGNDIASSTLQSVVDEEEHRHAALYQPAHWYNSAATREYNITLGSLLVRFPRELQGYRWKGMDDLLTLLSRDQRKFSKEAEDTIYATEPHQFWARVAEAKVLKQAEERGKNVPAVELSDKIRRLNDNLELNAWDAVALDESLAILKEAGGLE